MPKKKSQSYYHGNTPSTVANSIASSNQTISNNSNYLDDLSSSRTMYTARYLDTITHQPKTQVKEKDVKIKEATKNLLSNKINTNDYVQVLRNEGVNVEADAIKDCIKKQINGTPMNYANFIRTITIHKNDTVNHVPELKRFDKGTSYLREDDGMLNTKKIMIQEKTNEKRAP